MRRALRLLAANRREAQVVRWGAKGLRPNHGNRLPDRGETDGGFGAGGADMLSLRRQIGSIAVLAALCVPALSAQIVTHSARLDLTHGKPFVMVMVNGKGPFRFVIDTGTGGEAFVSPELAERLALPTIGKVHLSDPSGQGGKSAGMVQIDTLEVAGAEFHDVRAVVHALGNGDGYYEGLLGFVLFRDYLLTLDFPRRMMTLTEGELQPDGDRTVMPFRMPNGLPIVPMRIGALQVEAQIDSGGDGLSLPEGLSPHLEYVSEPTVFGNGQSLSTRFQIKAAQLAMDVHFGNYTFKKPFVEINGAFPLVNFGSCPMQDFALTFDQKKLLVRFSSKKKTHRLGTPPTPLQLANMPRPLPANLSLTPVD
jgi:Aspartyl protease